MLGSSIVDLLEEFGKKNPGEDMLTIELKPK
jgi:hypothetical protein